MEIGSLSGRISLETTKTGDATEPWSLQVVEIANGRIGGISFFLDTARLFPLFGLPPRLDP